jgi:hypothetical protein
MFRVFSTVNVASRFEPECFNITKTGSGLPKFDLFTNVFCTKHVTHMGGYSEMCTGFY